MAEALRLLVGDTWTGRSWRAKWSPSDSAPHTPQDVRHHLRRIKADTIIDMTFSNLIACECRRHGECHAGHALKPC